MKTITVNQKRCKKCGLCVAFCPQKVFEADEDGAPIVAHPEACIGCSLCVKRCPDFALKVEG